LIYLLTQPTIQSNPIRYNPKMLSVFILPRNRCLRLWSFLLRSAWRIIQFLRLFFAPELTTTLYLSFAAILFAATKTAHSLYLSRNQMHSIRGLLANPALTTPQRESIQNLLYVTHEKWALKKAIEFKQLHYYKCRDLSIEDLAFSGKIGLLKSSKIYDGRTAFAYFSEIYVKSELLRTMTKHLSITACISSKDRMAAKRVTYHYPIIIRHDRNTISAIFQPQMEIQHKEFYRSVWEQMESFDAFTKCVIRTKYTHDFKVSKSNRQVADAMCCSEETVRKSINLFADEYLERRNKNQVGI